MKQINHIIGGQEVVSTSGRTSEVFNPATGEVTGLVGLATVDEFGSRSCQSCVRIVETHITGTTHGCDVQVSGSR